MVAKYLAGAWARVRHFRVSLRTLLLLVVVIAVFLSWVVIPAVRQKAAIRWVESQRGDYSYDSQYRLGDDWYMPSGGVPIPKSAIEWFGIDAFASVTVVGLGTDEIYDLQPLAGLAGIEELYVNQFIHPQTDLSVLQSLRRLRKLHLTKWSGIDLGELEAISAMLPNVEIVADEFPEFNSKNGQP